MRIQRFVLLLHLDLGVTGRQKRYSTEQGKTKDGFSVLDPQVATHSHAFSTMPDRMGFLPAESRSTER